MSPTRLLEQHYAWLLQPGQTVSETQATPGFSGAVVYRVEIDDATWCVRQWPPDTSHKRLAAIHRLLQHVGRAGDIPVPVPLVSADRASVVRFRQRLWQVEPWLSGMADFDQHPTDARVTSAMTGLARWHQMAARYDPPPRDTRWLQPAREDTSPTVSSRLEKLAQWRTSLPETERQLMREPDPDFRSLGQQMTTLFRLLSNAIGEELQHVQFLRVRQQPCIRDLWHDHLLFRDDRLSGIIDYGAVRTDSVACDLSRLLGSLFGENPADWQPALNAYSQTSPLTTAEHQLLGPLGRSGLLLSGMTWLGRRARQRITPEQMPRVLARLRRIVERLESLQH